MTREDHSFVYWLLAEARGVWGTFLSLERIASTIDVGYECIIVSTITMPINVRYEFSAKSIIKIMPESHISAIQRQY